MRTKTSFLALLLVLGAAAVPAGAQYVCFPTCTANDGKFMSLAGDALATFDSGVVTVEFGLPSTETQLDFAIFDGDTTNQWDSIDGAIGLEYGLYEDPLGNGTGLVQVGLWTEANMLDNAWANFTVPVGPGAQAPSGNYFYRLSIRAVAPDPLAWTNFKVRTAATNSLSLKPQAFNFTGAIFAFADIAAIYPSFPAVTPTNYDGMWSFFTRIDSSLETVEFWDGDLDRGSFDCTSSDTDDPDTPGSPFLPPWASPTTQFEGVAVGELRACGQTTGAPVDDNDFPFFVRSPSVFYSVTDPLGNVFLNPNPSGNLEWERFALSTNLAEPADYHVAELPAGIYKIQMEGMDMSNFNSWFIPEVVGICDDGGGPANGINRAFEGDPLNQPCAPDLNPFLVGDFVWLDANGDGIQDGGPGEPGIAGVLMELLDANGLVVATTMTDPDGFYSFEVEAGTWSVRIAASNFGAGEALDGLASTTGGETQSNTVVDDNVLTYDFGYRAPVGSLGDRVWLDADGDGVQDGGETGINGVTVNLRDSGGNLLATQVTAGDGNYTFANLAAGTYTVEVVATTLPAGLAQTYDLDGLATAHRATLSLAAGESRTDVDFGYRAPTGGEGCTPGYWKQSQHFDSWRVYHPTDSFNAAFGVVAAGNPTLLQALSTGGGGFKALNRHAVAALLNAVQDEVNYLYLSSQVISLVQTAYATNNPEPFKNQLAAQNEMGCPLN